MGPHINSPYGTHICMFAGALRGGGGGGGGGGLGKLQVS